MYILDLQIACQRRWFVNLTERENERVGEMEKRRVGEDQILLMSAPMALSLTSIFS